MRVEVIKNVVYKESVVFSSYSPQQPRHQQRKYVDFKQLGKPPPKPRVVSSILTAPAIKKPVDTSSMGFNFFVLFEKWVVCALNVHYELNAVISVIPRFCYVDPDRLRESIGIFSIL